MEGLRDNVGIEIPGKVVIESGADVFIDGLKLYENKRQPVDETDQISAGVVMRHAHTLKLEFTHGEEPIVGFAILSIAVTEIDDTGMCMEQFA